MMKPERFNELQQQQVDIAHNKAEKEYLKHLNNLSDDLNLSLARVDEIHLMTKAEIDMLIYRMQVLQNARYKTANAQYAKFAELLSHYVSHTEAVGLGIDTAPKLIEPIQSTPLAASGLLLDEHLDLVNTYNNDRLNKTVRGAWANKATNSELKKVLTGTAAARYQDGLIHKQKITARSALDTATQHTMVVSKGETWQANDIYEYEIIATLDRRTTTRCRDEDGRIYRYGEGALPPFHYRCRTAIAPVTDLDYMWLSKGRTRASKDGYVDANMNWYEWAKSSDNPMREAA